MKVKSHRDTTGLADEIEETLDQVTNRVMEGLPRVQAIEALHGYQNMK
jgi:E3 ubiquitin-protein ligase UBR7